MKVIGYFIKRVCPVVLACLGCLSAQALEFSGNSTEVITVSPEASTGLEAIYVIDGTAGVHASFAFSGATAPTWQRYSSMGGAYAEPVMAEVSGGISSIVLSDGDMGYIVESEGRQHCFWVVDYSAHALTLRELTAAQSDDCAMQRLEFSGSASEIPYYTINGRRMVLSRDLEVTYNTLTFNEESFVYEPVEAVQTFASIGEAVAVNAPLCSTSFKLSGDRFLRQWGRMQSVESGSIQPYAVDAQTKATQEQRDADNEQKTQTDGLGGSAPCIIRFEAIVTDGALFHEWQIARDPEFEINELTYPELDIDLTFEEQGSTYVRLMAANADGSCQFAGPTYEIFIGESRLDIPNAFSPQNQDGVNDEWKVSFKSIVRFECHIFNRWGKKLFSTTDPAQGWDGRSGGKFVPAGVYYYVIKAEGADGVKYDKAGDINIVGYTQSATGTGGGEGGDAYAE